MEVAVSLTTLVVTAVKEMVGIYDCDSDSGDINNKGDGNNYVGSDNGDDNNDDNRSDGGNREGGSRTVMKVVEVATVTMTMVMVVVVAPVVAATTMTIVALGGSDGDDISGNIAGYDDDENNNK